MIRFYAKCSIASTLNDSLDFIKASYNMLQYDVYDREGKTVLLKSLAYFGTANLRYCYNQMNKFVCREEIEEVNPLLEKEATVAAYTARRSDLFTRIENIRVAVIAAIENDWLLVGDLSRREIAETLVRKAADDLKDLILFIEDPKY